MGGEYNNLRIQLGNAISEAKYWKTVVVYLAQCHSANASIVDLKSTSRYQRKRLVSIMRKCKGWLCKTDPAPSSYVYDNAENVATDIGKIIASLETHHPEVKKEL